MKLLKLFSYLLGKFPFPKKLAWGPYNFLNYWRLKRYLGSRLGPYCVEVKPGPIPSKEVFQQTGGVSEEKIADMFAPGAGFDHRYLGIARGTVREWFQAVEQGGGNLRTLSSVLDFGCGTGRLIRHFRMIDGLRLHGCDLNEEMVSWCQKNLSGITFKKNEVEPPLPFDDESFDLVCSYSVFTHIPVEYQDAWAAEMKRITRPGGFVIATVSGAWLQRLFLDEEDKKKIATEGYLQFTSEDSKASLATRLGGSAWDIYQPRSSIIDIFRPYFEIVDCVPGFQDQMVLRRPKAVGP